MTVTWMDRQMTVPGGRCELTDLYVRECAHCRRLPDLKPTRRIGAWLTALYPGRCVECDDYIEPGDHILRMIDGYVCVTCGLDMGDA